MKTLTEIRSALEIQYPTLSECDNGDDKQLTTSARKSILDQWAANMYAVEIENQAVLDKATAKAALLQRLGITADEAALLLG